MPAKNNNLHDIRKAAGKRGLASRWGDKPRPMSFQIRVDEDAAIALSTVPDRDRRQLASAAIRSAVAAYNQDHGA